MPPPQVGNLDLAMTNTNGITTTSGELSLTANDNGAISLVIPQLVKFSLLLIIQVLLSKIIYKFLVIKILLMPMM